MSYTIACHVAYLRETLLQESLLLRATDSGVDGAGASQGNADGGLSNTPRTSVDENALSCSQPATHHQGVICLRRTQLVTL